MTSKLEYHELSHYFPMLPKDEFEDLVDSIRRFGQLEPITLLDGKILDGRNRYEACMQLDVEPTFRQYGEDGYEPLDFVVAANMRRRHLTEAQKAQIIIDIEGIPRPGKGGPVVESAIPEDGTPSYSELGRKAGVSFQTISRVAEVQDDDTLVAELREGHIRSTEAQREYRARQGLRQETTTAKQAKYEGLDEVKWILEYISSWTRKIDDFIEAAKGGKFSPEAKQYTVRKLRKLSDKLLALLEVLDDETS